MARVNFKNFTPRPKPRKRPRRHKKNLNKSSFSRAKRYVRTVYCEIINQSEILEISQDIKDCFFDFGYFEDVLDGVDVQKQCCWNCGYVLNKFEGKNCMNKNCIHPNMKHEKKRIVQFHNECLFWLCHNTVHVCHYCLLEMFKFSYLIVNILYNMYHELL